MIPLWHALAVALFLFAAGLGMVFTRRHPLLLLAGLELLLNGVNIALVAFSRLDPNGMGQVFALFIMLVAACETAVLVGIIYLLFGHRKGWPL